MKKLSLLMAVVMAFSCFSYAVFAEETTADVEAIEIIVSEEAAEESENTVEEKLTADDLSSYEENTELDDSEELPEFVGGGYAQLNAVDYAVLDELASAISAEMLTSGNEPAHMVTRNLDMSLAGDLDIPEGITVTFTSSDTSVIKNDGTVERSFDDDKTVAVIATVSDGETGIEKTFDFTVLKADTLVLYSDNFYYPEAKDKEIIGYSASVYTTILPGAWKYGPFTSNPSPNVSSQIKFLDGEYVIDYMRMNSETGGETNLFVPIKIDSNSPNYSKIKYSMTLKPVTYTPATQRIDFALLANNAKLIDWFVFKSTTIQNNLQSPTQNISQTNTGFNTAGDNKIDVIIDYEAGTYTNVMNGNVLEAMRLPTGMETLKLNYMTVGLARWQINPAEFYLKDMAVTTEVDLEKPENIIAMVSEDSFSCKDTSSVYEDFSFVINSSLSSYIEEIGADLTLTSDSDLITVVGNDLRVTPSEDKEEVNITVIVSKDGESVEKTFTFTVYNAASVIRDGITVDMFTCPNPDEIVEDFSFVPSAYISEIISENGATVTITSNSSAIEIDGYNATVTRTDEVQDAVLTVSVSKDGIVAKKTFDMSVYNLLPADIFKISLPEITDDGTIVTARVDITCTDVVDVNAKITFVLVLRNNVSGKIASINYDTTTLAKNESDTLSTVLASLGDDYEVAYYFWNDIENAVPVTNSPPAEPEKIEMSEITTGSVRLTWNKADDDGKAVSYYNVYRSGNIIASTEDTTYVVENLDFGSEYDLSVTAVDKAGNESVEEIEITVETLNIPTVTLKSDNPEQPGNVQDAPEMTLITAETPGPYYYNEVAEIGGRICRKTTKHIRADGTIVISRFFFKVDTKYIPPSMKDIAIEATFFDKGTATITNESQGGGGGSYRMTDTGCWKTHTFIVNSAAYTATGAYDGANFRFATNDVEDFYVYQTSISRLEDYRQPAASFKVDDVIVLRDIRYFAADNQATVTKIGGKNAAQVNNGNYIEIDFEEIRIDSSMNELTFEIEYFDDGTDNVNIEYASTSGPKTYSFEKTNTNKWMTKIIKVSDAKFDESITGVTDRKVDMRVSGENETLYVKTIKAY